MGPRDGADGGEIREKREKSSENRKWLLMGAKVNVLRVGSSSC